MCEIIYHGLLSQESIDRRYRTRTEYNINQSDMIISCVRVGLLIYGIIHLSTRLDWNLIVTLNFVGCID